MQLGSTRPAAKKHLPEECNPTAEWHYFSTIQQAIAALFFSVLREIDDSNDSVSMLHMIMVSEILLVCERWWSMMINGLTVIDPGRWREWQVTHGFAKKNGSTMVTKAQSVNGSIAKAPKHPLIGLLQLTLTALTALSCRPHNTLDLSWSQF